MGAPTAGTATWAGNHVGAGRQHCPMAIAIVGKLSTGTRRESHTLRVIVTGWFVIMRSCGGEGKKGCGTVGVLAMRS